MLNAKNLGLAAGILWGAAMFLMTWASMWCGYGTKFLELIMTVYPWYELTPMGSLVGLVWGFLDGFIGLYIFGWLYNKLGG